MKISSSCRVFILYAFIMLACLLAGFVPFHGLAGFDGNSLKIYPESFSDGRNNLGYRLLEPAAPRNAVFRAYVSETDLKGAGEGNYAILVCHLSCQAYSIYFNNTFLGSVGDMQGARSSIWNSANWFFIDRAALRPSNELKIEIKSSCDMGLRSPVLITDVPGLNRYLGRAGFFSGGAGLAGIGLTASGSAAVFMLFLISKPRKISYLYFSLALLFISVFTLDYTTFYSLPFSYLAYKKLIFAALYLSVAAVSMGIYEAFRSGADRAAAIATLAGILAIVIFSRDAAVFIKNCGYYSLMLCINLLSWLHTACKNFKRSEEAKVLLIGSSLLLPYGALDAYMTISGRAAVFSITFACTLIFSTIPFVLFSKELTNKERQLQWVRLKHSFAYKTSITDGMTGLYNHAHMVSMLQEAAPPYSVAMLDIDDFKEINDSFGHRFGDTVIRHIAANLKKYVRSSDMVFRYGGDEFFIILRECPAEKAMEIMLKMKRKIETDCPWYGDRPVRLTLSGGIYYVEKEETAECIFDKADSALYCSKKRGKNSISIYA